MSVETWKRVGDGIALLGLMLLLACGGVAIMAAATKDGRWADVTGVTFVFAILTVAAGWLVSSSKGEGVDVMRCVRCHRPIAKVGDGTWHVVDQGRLGSGRCDNGEPHRWPS